MVVTVNALANFFSSLLRMIEPVLEIPPGQTMSGAEGVFKKEHQSIG
jgi:hypothetical protein